MQKAKFPLICGLTGLTLLLIAIFASSWSGFAQAVIGAQGITLISLSLIALVLEWRYPRSK